MSYNQNRFTSYIIDGLLAVAISLLTAPAMAVDMVDLICPTTLSQNLGEEAIQQIRNTLEESSRDFQRAIRAVPKEFAHTVNQSLPWFKRVDLLNPVQPRAQIIADAYYGSDYFSSSPDVHILPSDPQILCLLQPGRTVFLSDGVTHHYAIVYDIDYQRKIITLADPWAKESFLLAGHNMLGVKALPRKKNGQLLLDLTFNEFLHVLRGSVEAIVPQKMFETMEKLYPKMAISEDYLVWKYSRLLASGDYSTSVLITLELLSSGNIKIMPRLRTLFQWGNDYIIGLISGFEIPELGRPAEPFEIPKHRESFIQRIDDYGKILPWPLKWLLLRRTDQMEDVELSLLIIDGFLKADPDDDDFQIERAKILLHQGQVNESMAQLYTAETQWNKDVLAAIANTDLPQAITFLFEKNYGIDFLMVLHWRYQRIHLLRLIAKLQQPDSRQIDVEQVLSELQDKYVIGSLLVDFFPQMLQITFLDQQRGNEELFIKTVSELANTEKLSIHFASAMYEHFTMRRSIKKLSPSTLTALRQSPVYRELCILAENDVIIPNVLKPLHDDLASLCDLYVISEEHKY